MAGRVVQRVEKLRCAGGLNRGTKCEEETKPGWNRKTIRNGEGEKVSQKTPGEHGTIGSDKKDERRREPSSENMDTKRGRGSASHNKRYPFKEAVLRRRGK